MSYKDKGLENFFQFWERTSDEHRSVIKTLMLLVTEKYWALKKSDDPVHTARKDNRRLSKRLQTALLDPTITPEMMDQMMDEAAGGHTDVYFPAINQALREMDIQLQSGQDRAWSNILRILPELRHRSRRQYDESGKLISFYVYDEIEFTEMKYEEKRMKRIRKRHQELLDHDLKYGQGRLY